MTQLGFAKAIADHGAQLRGHSPDGAWRTIVPGLSECRCVGCGATISARVCKPNGRLDPDAKVAIMPRCRYRQPKAA